LVQVMSAQQGDKTFQIPPNFVHWTAKAANFEDLATEQVRMTNVP
jgi:hypothetical protein